MNYLRPRVSDIIKRVKSSNSDTFYRLVYSNMKYHTKEELESSVARAIGCILIRHLRTEGYRYTPIDKYIKEGVVSKRLDYSMEITIRNHKLKIYIEI